MIEVELYWFSGLCIWAGIATGVAAISLIISMGKLP